MIASSSSNRTTCSQVVGTKDSKFHFAFGFCGPLAHIFKAACQKCLIYMIFLRIHIGSSFDKRCLSSKLLPIWTHRISMWILIITMTTPSKTTMAPGKPLPRHQVCVVSLESLHCVYWKKTGHFCSKFCWEKSIFECMIGTWRFVGCVIFPSNEYNDGHPCLWQWLLLVLVPMIVYIAKIALVFAPKVTEKSPF
jgi:hypothetical protein